MIKFLTEPVWCDDRERRNRIQVPRWEWWVEFVAPFILVAIFVVAVALFARGVN